MKVYCVTAIACLWLLIPTILLDYVTDNSEFYTETDMEDDCLYSECGNPWTGFNTENERDNYESKMWEEIMMVLTSNETQTFISSFNSSFERRTIYQQLVACPFTPLCEYNLSTTLRYTQDDNKLCCLSCKCDFPNCLKNESCCLDIIYRNADVLRQEQHGLESTESCVKMDLSTSIYDKVQTDAIMHASCPTNTSQQLRRNCTRKYSSDLSEFKDIAPVVDVFTFDLYRNAYCGLCHGFSDERFVQADLFLSCKRTIQIKSESDLIKSVMLGNDFNLTFGIPHFINRNFCTVAVSECNETGLWLEYDHELERACKLYKTVIRIENVVYQNIFCAFCNGISFKNQTKCDFFVYSHVQSFSFTGLLKLGADVNPVDEVTDNDNCSKNQLYDSEYDTCRDLFCSPHKKLQRGHCVDIYIVVKEIIYNVFLKITPLEITNVLYAYTVANDMLENLKSYYWENGEVCGMQMIYKTDAPFGKTSTSDVINSTVKYFIVRIEIYMSFDHDPNTFAGTVRSLDQLQTGILYYEEETKRMNTFQVKLQLIDHDSSMFDNIANLSMSEFFDMQTLYTFDLPLEMIIERFSVPDDTPGLQFPHLRGNYQYALCWVDRPTVNVIQMKPCPMVKFYKKEILWEVIETGVRIARGSYNLSWSEFYFENNASIAVCSDVYKKYLVHQRNHLKTRALSVETIVSIVSSCLSIVCLLITFVVFCVLSKLREKLPGKNSMTLVFVLLCAQIMYLITGIGVLDVRSGVCTILGSILHFLWLLSMFWMNICTYHMLHVLTKMTVVTNDSWICRYAIYHVYAIFMSTIPVATNISISISNSESYGYGEVVCYISSQKMVTFTFGIPTALVIFVNLIMYVYAMIKIKMASIGQETVQNQRNNLVIFAKLSTITGMTWIFGFIYSWTNLVVFSYLFILLNAGQGIFLLLAFICNYRVLKIFKSEILGRSVTLSDNGLKTSKHLVAKPTNSLNGDSIHIQSTKL